MTAPVVESTPATAETRSGSAPRPPRWTVPTSPEMRSKLRRRHIVNAIMVGLVGLAALLATLPLALHPRST